MHRKVELKTRDIQLSLICQMRLEEQATVHHMHILAIRTHQNTHPLETVVYQDKTTFQCHMQDHQLKQR